MSKVVSRTYETTIYDTEEYELRAIWNTSEARHTYKLYNKHKVCTDGIVPYYKWVSVSSGDKEWAQRTSEHYRIPITGESK